MNIDYFVLCYDDDITTPYKGEIMQRCLARVHQQTVPVNITIVVAGCTPLATLEYIDEHYPQTNTITRGKAWDSIPDCMDTLYNSSDADMVIFSKIISPPYIARAEIHAHLQETRHFQLY